MSGTVGLLKGIALPQGGEYSLTYTRVGNTVDMPQSRWVLSSITRDDGISAMAGAPADRGIHSYMQQYAYSNGYYHRGERLFYGFAQVTTSTTGGAITTTHYLNRDYSVRGMASGSELDGPYAGGNRALYQRSIIDVRAKEVSKGKNARGELVPIDFPRVVSETNQQYQAGTSSFVETRKEYGYDDFGNISELHDYGTLGEPSQAVHVFIEYDSIAGADYQKQSPTRITV